MRKSRTKRTRWLAPGALLLGGVVLAGGRSDAFTLVHSEASAYAEASSQLCASESTGTVGVTRYVCNIGNTTNVFVSDQEVTDSTGSVSMSGTGSDFGYFAGGSIGIVTIPVGPLQAEARASSDAYVNRAYARTIASSNVSGGEDIQGAGNEARYNDTGAEAIALSQWAEEITFTGGVALGQGAMRFAIDGNVSFSSYGNPSLDHGQPEGASMAFAPFDTVDVGGNEMVFAIDVFDSQGDFVTGGRYVAYSDGSVSDFLTVFVPFQYGETYTFVGTLVVSSLGFGLNEISCIVLPGGGHDCAVNGSQGAQSTLDFESTVTVASLTVPAGTTAIGTNGSALPFPVVVPEPASAALLALGLAGLGARSRRRHAR